MSSRIEDYAMIGDCQTAALVCRNGSIDWLCLPRFDSGACFAALLGEPKHGRWLLAPTGEVRSNRRRYREGTLVLETDFETDQGLVTVVDCMPQRDKDPNLVRLVVGKRGRVEMRMELIIRFDYGSVVPWVRRTDHGIRAIGGPDAVVLDTPVQLHGKEKTTVAKFTVSEGQEVPFVLTWFPSNKKRPAPVDPQEAIRQTEQEWRDWSARCKFQGPYKEIALRSLITLKALTFAPTGGIAAAPTTSLPEQLGGVRNWDYRFCWLRDATLTLYALLNGGYTEEAVAWREWMLRAVAGAPDQTNIMYGLGGERRLTEIELPWLPGYDNSKPVRVGNAAHSQFQLDVYGEMMDALHAARKAGVPENENAWKVQRVLLEYLSTAWRKPDDGIWEVRGERRDFVNSKVMAWVAFDRMIKDVEQFGGEGPADKWRQIRDEIHQDVCSRGFNSSMNSFVQYYGAKVVDASLLMIPLVGFLPATDPRMRGTVARIEKDLMKDGFLKRYPAEANVDGLPPGEGAFLPCTFWLADCYTLMGRADEARATFERLLGLCNDVGLISEEYDPEKKRLLGNFPQAFTHVALVNTVTNLSRADGPAKTRCNGHHRPAASPGVTASNP